MAEALGFYPVGYDLPAAGICAGLWIKWVWI